MSLRTYLTVLHGLILTLIVAAVVGVVVRAWWPAAMCAACALLGIVWYERDFERDLPNLADDSDKDGSLKDQQTNE